MGGTVGAPVHAEVMRELYLLDEPAYDTSWQEHARCATVDPEVMLGTDLTAAAEICHWCAVKDECGAYAEANDERFGVWGGVDRTALSP